jgi:hypothetical protein
MGRVFAGQTVGIEWLRHKAGRALLYKCLAPAADRLCFGQ